MIHLLVGNTGSGKTTYAKALQKKTKGILFSIDTWNKTLYLQDKKPTDGLEWFLERIERAETMIQNLVLQLHEAQVDAILDLGLSKKSHRDKFRAFAQNHAIDVTLHYLDIPKEIRYQRVMNRNHEKGETFEFEVSKENFDFMEAWFEAPSKDELEKSIIIKS